MLALGVQESEAADEVRWSHPRSVSPSVQSISQSESGGNDGNRKSNGELTMQDMVHFSSKAEGVLLLTLMDRNVALTHTNTHTPTRVPHMLFTHTQVCGRHTPQAAQSHQISCPMRNVYNLPTPPLPSSHVIKAFPEVCEMHYGVHVPGLYSCPPSRHNLRAAHLVSRPLDDKRMH